MRGDRTPRQVLRPRAVVWHIIDSGYVARPDPLNLHSLPIPYS